MTEPHERIYTTSRDMTSSRLGVAQSPQLDSNNSAPRNPGRPRASKIPGAVQEPGVVLFKTVVVAPRSFEPAERWTS